jgi:alkaline phosphatase D
VLSAPNLHLPRDGHPRFDHDPFALGVASGQPRPTSVVLWTRLMADPLRSGASLPPVLLPLTWEVSEDEGFSRIVRSGTVLADPAQAHSVRIRVEHLRPDWRYWYRFIAGGIASPVGRTRTAPAEHADVARLRLALASCQHYEQGWFTAHREMAGLDLDAVVFVGDYIYDSSNHRFRLRSHEAEQPRTLAEFRARHATYKRDPDLQACHAAHPWLLAWDDHEVRNDYAGEVGDGDDLPPVAFLQVRTAAYQAYFEHLPLALDQTPGPAGLRMHDRFRWGRLADLWLLDGRQYRSVQACNGGDVAGGRPRWRCRELADKQRTMLGAAQERWLQEGLRTSGSRWRLIAQATQLSPWGLPGPDGRPLVYSDGWDGYPQARARLLAHLARHRLDNTVFLGGDVHRHVAAQLRADNIPGEPVVASEFVTSSITSAGMPDALMSLIRSSNPDILHARSDERGYMQLDVMTGSLHCVARATGFPVLTHSNLATQARFVVEAGRAGPQRE